MKYICTKCNNPLLKEGDKLICKNCNLTTAFFNNNIVIFNECEQKTDFFDKQSVERLHKMYNNYTFDNFVNDLTNSNLSNMDLLNKKVGITTKFWWEKHIGIIEDKNILEVGCGVNYLVPYWLYNRNIVTAFDISKEAVFLLKDIITNLRLPVDNLELFVCDVEQLNIDKKFDIISISNVLHHIDNKSKVLHKLKSMLKEDGKILIVEPNYFYPFRWMVETNLFGRLNLVKLFFENNYLIEKNEKAIIFKELKNILVSLDYKIDINLADKNYLGYATIYFLDKYPWLVKMIYFLDKLFIHRFMPKLFAPFEYLVVSRK